MMMLQIALMMLQLVGTLQRRMRELAERCSVVGALAKDM